MNDSDSILMLRAELAAMNRRVAKLELLLDVNSAMGAAALRALLPTVKKLARSRTVLPLDSLSAFACHLEHFDERDWILHILEVVEPMPWIDVLRVLVAHRGLPCPDRDRAEHHMRAVARNLLELQGYGAIDPDEFLGIGDVVEECVVSVLGGL